MKFLSTPIPPYGFRSYAWTGQVDDLVWSASLANVERGISFAKITSHGKDTELQIDLYDHASAHWEDFVRVATRHFPDMPESSSIAAALELLRRVHYADKRITVFARSRLVYRLADAPPYAFEVANIEPSPCAIGHLRLAYGERIDRVFTH